MRSTALPTIMLPYSSMVLLLIRCFVIVGRHNLLLLHKQADDKRGITDSLHGYTTRARLAEFEVGVFSRES